MDDEPTIAELDDTATDTSPEGEETPPPQPVLLPDPVPDLSGALARLNVIEAVRSFSEASATRSRHAEEHQAALAAVADAEQAVDRSEAVLADLAVLAFMRQDVTTRSAVGDLGTAMESSRAHSLAVTVADTRIAQLENDRTVLFLSQVYEAATAQDLAAADQALRAAADDLADARLQATAPEPLAPPLTGPSALNAAELTAWYQDQYGSLLSPLGPVDEIAALYVNIGAEENVRGDVAFIQAVLETGGFTSGHARNFNMAGIGAYDSCSPECGWVFPSLEDGVTAHLHLLAAYANSDLNLDDLARTPDPRVAPGNVGVQGCCPRWDQLTGVWATDINYHRKVLGLYSTAVTRALRDRQPFGD